RGRGSGQVPHAKHGGRYRRWSEAEPNGGGGRGQDKSPMRSMGEGTAAGARRSRVEAGVGGKRVRPCGLYPPTPRAHCVRPAVPSPTPSGRGGLIRLSSAAGGQDLGRLGDEGRGSRVEP